MTKLEKIARLIEMENNILASFYADSIMRGGEEYPSYYRKNPRAIKSLLKSEMQANIAMRKYFSELNDRIVENLNWNEYERKISSHSSNHTKAPRTHRTLKGGILDYLVQAFWENETLVLKIYLTKALVDALEGGGLFSEDELKVEVGWSRENAPAIEFLNKYSLSAAKSLTATTKKRVIAALKTSIDNGEDRNGAIDRISKTVKDRVRATAIAQTESVRAFSAGRMEVGRQVGADRKKWRTAGDNKVSTICRSNELLGVVPFDYKYNDVSGDKVTEPPAHVNCRSGIQLFMPGEKI